MTYQQELAHELIKRNVRWAYEIKDTAQHLPNTPIGALCLQALDAFHGWSRHHIDELLCDTQYQHMNNRYRSLPGRAQDE